MRFLILLWISISTCFGQDYFEGQIIYKVTVVKKSKDLDPKLLSDYDNKIWTYDFKNGNFKWSFPSTFWIGHIYNQKTNRLYNIAKDSDLATWYNGKNETDSVINIKISKTKIKILNNSCNLLTIKTKYLSENLIRIRNYYYSANTAINPEWSKNYKGNNFDMIYKLTKSIPLKIIDDFGTFKITYEAIEIKRKKTENSIFKIDPKLRLEELVIKK